MRTECFVKDYLQNYQNDKSDWTYEDGCILIGCQQLFEATNDEYYKQFILQYMNHFITEDGEITFFDPHNYNIDSMNTGKVLLFLYEQTKDNKYRIALERLMDGLRQYPRTECGNFWHKKVYPNQVWLDGLYMAQPFYMAYETKFNNKENYNDIMKQFNNVRKYIFSEEKQLYHHIYDESRVAPWADNATGLSQDFLLRSTGWYLMALIDTIDAMSIEIFEHYKTLVDLFKEAVKGILKYQDQKNKLFYDFIDQSNVKGNYTDTTGSIMIAYALLKGCRLGVLSKEKYQHTGMEIFEVCQEAGVGQYIMAYAEVLKQTTNI